MNCRFCNALLSHRFIDLANSPPSNAFLTAEQLNEPETFYPLHLFVCESCFLVQIAEYKRHKEIFNNDYVYFSSYSKTWLKHANKYVDMITEKLCLTSESQVLEIASNDGYLLQYFLEKGIPCLGIEPAKSVAQVAQDRGIPVIQDFFTSKLAKKITDQGKQADLIIGNNVLAHVPDINDFVTGLKVVLKKGGIVTLEFPHLLQMVEKNQFDTIYHEHYSYFSFLTVEQIFATHGLEVFDVEELSTHGGSLRIFAKHKAAGSSSATQSVVTLKKKEIMLGLNALEYYQGFQAKADRIKYDLLSFLLEQRKAGKKVAAYGAAAKGNTLLNYCGIKKDLIPFVVDASPYKQGKFLPGSHIPVVAEKTIRELKPDFVLILPWNIKEEIIVQLAYLQEWGGKFLIPIPHLKVVKKTSLQHS
ncbi:MAG: methyltransferase domain-containing protein [Candidatus Hodarchaeales archaeon]|jgi:2-polyprenyl-3-methyl-5-hydroxy-6-metoxy-1,4-benzoquinol methylase